MKRLGLLLLLLPALPCQALEVAPGDYEQLPDGTNLLLFYFQNSRTDAAYVQGDKISSDYTLTSNIGILRLVHAFELTETLTINPQLLLPFGHVSGSDDASPLGSANGLSDLILASAFILRLNEARDVIGFTPYLHLPTGNYDKHKSLNLGDNRWKLDLQVAYIKHINPKWAVDLTADVIYYGDNDDYSSSSLRREQDTSYATQLIGRYALTASTSLAAGIGYNWGGENTVAKIEQDDEMRTTNFRLTATTFITPSNQIQLQLGRDIKVENGVHENLRINLRYNYIF